MTTIQTNRPGNGPQDTTPYLVLSASDQGNDINMNLPITVIGWNAAVLSAHVQMAGMLAQMQLELETDDALSYVTANVPKIPDAFSATYTNNDGPFTVSVQPAPVQYVLNVSVSDTDLETLDVSVPVVSTSERALRGLARQKFTEAVRRTVFDRDENGLSPEECFDQNTGKRPVSASFIRGQITVRVDVDAARQL